MAHKLTDKERTSDVKLNHGAEIQFSNLLLSSKVQKGLTKAGFVTPSPIQLEAIPIGRCGFDLIVQAKSGTGKTCVFAVVALDSVNTDMDYPQVLVLAPTREIVVQIAEVVTTIASSMPKLRCHSFIGGMPIAKDKLNIKKCHIAIGTPGRIKQLILEKFLKTDSIRLFVLDEADKLLEGNFQEDINWIYYSLPGSKQMLALSATYPDELAQLLTKYMLSPTFVRLSAQSPALLGVKQFYKLTAFHTSQHRLFENKVPLVLDILTSLPFGQCLVFSNFQTRAQGLCDRLNSQGWPATYICGKQDQTTRLEAISRLREFKCRILISTDLIARGIDVENVNLIINLDVPWDVETYLHRIGRAGRFGTFGIAITLAARGAEEELLQQLNKEGSLEMQELPDHIDRDLIKKKSQEQSPPSTETQKIAVHDTTKTEKPIHEPKKTTKTNGSKSDKRCETAKQALPTGEHAASGQIAGGHITGGQVAGALISGDQVAIERNAGGQVTGRHYPSTTKIGAAFIESLKHERNLQLEAEGIEIKSKRTKSQTPTTCENPITDARHRGDLENGRSDDEVMDDPSGESDRANSDDCTPETSVASSSEPETTWSTVVDFPTYDEMVADLDNFCAGHLPDDAKSCEACLRLRDDFQEPKNSLRVNRTSAPDSDLQMVTLQLSLLLRDYETSCLNHVKPIDSGLSDRMISRSRELVFLGQPEPGLQKSTEARSKSSKPGMKAVIATSSVKQVFRNKSTSKPSVPIVSSVTSGFSLPPLAVEIKSAKPKEVEDDFSDASSDFDESESVDSSDDECNAASLSMHDRYSNTSAVTDSTGNDSRCRNSEDRESDEMYEYRVNCRLWDEWYRSVRMQKYQLWYSEYFRYMLKR